MFVIPSYSLAVIFCVITMLCWGSWANAQKLASSNWRFELFYWDFVLGVLFVSLLLAFTLGSWGGEGRSFIPDLMQADSSALGSALLGGIIFNLSNILLSAAIAIAGMAVAFPVGVGLALVIGVVVNYLELPVGDAGLLSVGVGFIVVAILLNAGAYRRLSQGMGGVSGKGLLLAVVSGCLMGLFYRYVAASMFPDFTVPEAGMLSPYTAVVVFALGVFVSNILFNTILMRYPFTGAPVSYSDYFEGSWVSHLTGVLGGAIWCIGMAFSIIASDKAGPAIAYGLGQGATVVAALWGIYIWREFRNAPRGTHAMLHLMLACYIVGLTMLVAAR
ncbi:multidrug DMT transporter permease [Pontibacter diazotrophicus]|uniref:Multidrug DMT transporter permease n=1 Tax=Pontibacter diazotrophicus TaxID=1400979 RepID=A0A3D8LID8_9BACT|nr:multidrug DMT transporter permease [Pontibacter diazotrophicus]RDV17211.1 multidrug DMT transporter permease [Pontibacter diazotrophicus]